MSSFLSALRFSLGPALVRTENAVSKEFRVLPFRRQVFVARLGVGPGAVAGGENREMRPDAGKFSHPSIFFYMMSALDTSATASCLIFSERNIFSEMDVTGRRIGIFFG
ncbi:MAG TPA: hypothetical protein PLA90_01365 [Candidatus Sumerlaeota bacterium]|nr:hypothetical protein [Candidatus Sumerlaeota bacterium]HPS00167.1 hypothetical protein [Candidatus Sumerlaeota bacterium]